MPRWLAYDHAAETALTQRFGRACVQPQAGDREAVLSALLSAGEAAVALLPATSGETLLITRRPLRATSAQTAPPRAYEPTGFLGLHDEPIFDDEPAAPKTWWEKFWD